MRALISVWDKSGVADFAAGLAGLGFEIVASGGTAAHLAERGVEVTRTETLTGFAELLGHRVVTLHPALHAGILARRDAPGDVADLAAHGIEPFDLVCVNLYPFADEPSVETIDIGGPSLLRGAAKNFAHVAAVSRPDQYPAVLEELRSDGSLSARTRRKLASEAFATTARYEAAIVNWFSQGEAFPETITISLARAADLAYGENPHQRGAYYAEVGATDHLLAGVEQLQGRRLSLINLYDLSAARDLLEELRSPACVIVKHANPCGVALGGSIEEAYERALAADPLSAFGMVCALNRPVSAALGSRLAERFVDVLYAPSYEAKALSALSTKEATRVLAGPAVVPAGERDYKRVRGGFLVQDPDTETEALEAMRVVCGEPTDGDWADLLFAWRVCKHVTSNAIVVASGQQTIGIGAGQTSRVDAVRIALEKARELGHDLAGAALASDAFFPFADGPRLALEAGVSSIVQPGGSKRDDEVIDAVRSAGGTMVLTGRRHFRH
jgi:phosphoribosylaminoimidazolecarboxamide formyltransferase / IMP cyclohydrolase